MQGKYGARKTRERSADHGTAIYYSLFIMYQGGMSHKSKTDQ
jgi:hypothetical protein